MRYIAPISFMLLFNCVTALAGECAATTAEALKQSRHALKADDDAQARKALECLTDAVEQLHERLEALIAGQVPFTGDITAPAYIYPTEGNSLAGQRSSLAGEK